MISFLSTPWNKTNSTATAVLEVHNFHLQELKTCIDRIARAPIIVSNHIRYHSKDKGPTVPGTSKATFYPIFYSRHINKCWRFSLICWYWDAVQILFSSKILTLSVFLCLLASAEALHLAHLMSAHGYFFPIDDHILTVKADGTFYRFQVYIRARVILGLKILLQHFSSLFIRKLILQ